LLTNPNGVSDIHIHVGIAVAGACAPQRG
jgi:hypothetical protein